MTATITVPSPDELIAVVRRHEDFAGAFRLMQERLRITNAALEDICGFASGMVDKYLGPGQVKNIGDKTFNELCGGLALEFRAHLNLDGARVMADVWEGRQRPLRPASSKISSSQFERLKPHVLQELSRRGNEARRVLLPATVQAKIARKAARARARLPKAVRSEISRKGWMTRRAKQGAKRHADRG